MILILLPEFLKTRNHSFEIIELITKGLKKTLKIYLESNRNKSTFAAQDSATRSLSTPPGPEGSNGDRLIGATSVLHFFILSISFYEIFY